MYKTRKGFKNPGHQEKGEGQKFVTPEQVERILDSIPREHRHFARDHALISLTYYLGLRIGEAVMLQQKHFRLIDEGTIYVPTLKQALRVSVECAHCGKKARIGTKRKKFRCMTCLRVTRVEPQEEEKESPEVPLTLVEKKTIGYIKSYLETLDPKCEWLFPSPRAGCKNLSRRMAQYIIQTHMDAAGLSAKVSAHALRHGRGVRLWSRLRDYQAVKDGLRHKSMTTSQIYIHMSPDDRRRALAALEEDDPRPEGER